MRRAIGASRAQLVRLQLAEAVVAALLGGALAVVLAATTLPAIVHAAPARLPRLDEVVLTGRSLLFALLAALVSGVGCGMAASLRAASPDLARLREGGRGSTGRRKLAREGLVAAQTAMALVLLIRRGAADARCFLALAPSIPATTHATSSRSSSLRSSRSQGRPDLGALPPRIPGPAGGAPRRSPRGAVENVPLDEGMQGDRFRSEDMPGDPMLAGPSTSRSRPATTSEPWASTSSRAGVSRPPTTSRPSGTWW